MKIVEINSVNHGSTGTIMRNIALEAESEGIDTTICFQQARSTRNESYTKCIRIGSRVDRNIHLRLGRITGKYGLYSKWATRKFLKKIDVIKPDLIHLHNLHKGYINIEILFEYIKKNDIPVVWTLHDCWSFTGQCPYFDRVKCNRWCENECGECPQYREYPSNVDRTHYMYTKKKAAFTGVRNLNIVTPSEWLAGLVKKSFLSEYPVKVIPNGIDLNVFRPIESDIRLRYEIGDRIVILGVASIWDIRKRLDVFTTLYEKLPKEEYKIVLIGLSKEQIASLPKGIVGVERTSNVEELAKFYTAADVFLNPTVEDNFPTVNLEALACGTPVFTFDTGGSAECLLNKSCGKIVEENTLCRVMQEFSKSTYDSNLCIEAAQSFSAEEKFREYVELYKNIYRGERY